jgi:hypothetical protein
MAKKYSVRSQEIKYGPDILQRVGDLRVDGKVNDFRDGLPICAPT